MRAKTIAWILMIYFLLAFAPGSATACTCFSVESETGVLVGRNYDWDFSDGLVLVNKRDVAKPYAVFDVGDDRGWTSEYGSVTFTQYGRDFPQGGINEKGLVIEILWLNGSEFPPDDERTDLGVGQWIQYQLDTAASVAEVLESFREVQIRQEVEVHYFLTDRSGGSATVEFVHGRRVVHRSGREMPAAVLTNHSYERSVSYLREHEGWGGSRKIPESSGSLDRFVRAASLARQLDRESMDVASLFRILDAVSQGEHTQWSIVYDLDPLRVQFKTHRSPGVKTIALADLDFSCDRPVLMVDIDSAGNGPLEDRWIEYTRDANLDLVRRAFHKTSFLEWIPDETLELIASHPDRSVCAR